MSKQRDTVIQDALFPRWRMSWLSRSFTAMVDFCSNITYLNPFELQKLQESKIFQHWDAQGVCFLPFPLLKMLWLG